MTKKPDTPEIKLIPVEDILQPKEALRTLADEDKMKELISSIKQYGLIHPIVVFPKGKKYEIFAGHRRYIACRALKWDKIPCYIRSASEADRDFMKLQENTVREDVNPVDQARHLQYMINKYHFTQDEIAEQIGKKRPTVTNLLRLLRYPDFLREAVERGQIKQMIAHILVQIDDPTVLKMYVGHAIKGGLSQEAARSWVQNYIVSKESETKRTAPPDKQEVVEDRPRFVPKCHFCGLTTDKSPIEYLPICNRCKIDIPEILGKISDKE